MATNSKGQSIPNLVDGFMEAAPRHVRTQHGPATERHQREEERPARHVPTSVVRHPRAPSSIGRAFSAVGGARSARATLFPQSASSAYSSSTNPIDARDAFRRRVSQSVVAQIGAKLRQRATVKQRKDRPSYLLKDLIAFRLRRNNGSRISMFGSIASKSAILSNPE